MNAGGRPVWHNIISKACSTQNLIETERFGEYRKRKIISDLPAERREELIRSPRARDGRTRKDRSPSALPLAFGAENLMIQIKKRFTA
jgi:hypothetical protein